MEFALWFRIMDQLAYPDPLRSGEFITVSGEPATGRVNS